MKSIFDASNSLRESQKVVREKLNETPATELEAMYSVHIGLKVTLLPLRVVEVFGHLCS